MTVSKVLWELIPHIANPLEVAIAHYDIEVKVQERRIKERIKQAPKALATLIEEMQTFCGYLSVLKDMIAKKIEEDTDVSVGVILYGSVDFETDPRLSEEQKVLKRKNAKDTVNAAEKINDFAKVDLERILVYQIKRMDGILADAKELQKSVWVTLM